MVFPCPPSISVWHFGDGGVEASGVEVWDVCEGELMRGAGVGEGEGVVGRGKAFVRALWRARVLALKREGDCVKPAIVLSKGVL